MMKKMLFVSAVIICSVGYAQKTTIINESFTDTQARMIEANFKLTPFFLNITKDYNIITFFN